MAVATIAVGVVGAGVAYANVGFSVPNPDGLSDGQSVQIHLSGINAIAFATVDISECANAYTDNTLLTTLSTATDCKDLGQIDVSHSTTLTTSVTVMRTGIGLGNRSCVSGGNFPCDLRVSLMKNQGTSPVPPPVTITFATDPPPGTPDTTTTTVSETGAPAAFGKTAYARVVVTSPGNFVPEGNATVTLDGVDLASQPIDTHGAVSIPLGTPALGHHTLSARFDGNGSFSASTAPGTSFDVIAATNISAGDVTLLEGDTGYRKIYVPVVLSQTSLATVTVHYAVHDGSATAPSDYNVIGAGAGTLTYAPGTTIKFVQVKVNGDTNLEGTETLRVDLSSPSSGWDFRRDHGTVTILDDDPGTAIFAAGVGDATMPEGDIGRTHSIKLPVTLSNAAPVTVTIYITMSTGSAIHRTGHTLGDWGGPIQRKVKIRRGQLRSFVSIPTYPDLSDESDLVIHATITSASPGVSVQRSLGTATILSDE